MATHATPPAPRARIAAQRAAREAPAAARGAHRARASRGVAALALAAAGVVLTSARASHAQRTAGEWVTLFDDEARAGARAPHGAVALLRLWDERDWDDASAVAERLRAHAEDPRAPALRRGLARWLEAETRARLGQRGDARRLTEGLGYLTRWLVLGPFDNEGRGGFAPRVGPEEQPDAPLDLGRAYEGRERPARWRVFPDVSNLGYVALDALVRPTQNVCAFAYTTVTARSAGDAVLWLGAGGAVRALVNGRVVYEDPVPHGAFPDRVGARVRLERGLNRVLLKVCADTGDLGFYARFTSLDGAPRADLAPNPEALTGFVAAPPTRPLVTNAPARPRPALGPLAELAALAARPNARAEDLEAYARLLVLTRSDDPAAPAAPDLAERAANAAPSVQRWLLVAELTSNRNRRLLAIGRALALEPNNASALLAMGREQQRGARAEDGLPWLERAIAADDALVSARLERALLLDRMGLALTAYRSLDEAYARAPFSTAVLTVRAAVAEHAQLHEAAQGLRRELLRVRDDDPRAHEAVARGARVRGERELARREADRMVSARPDRIELYLGAAELLEAVGDGDVALGVLARAGDLAPDEPSVWRARGELAVRLGRVDEGRGDMRRALALSPQDRTLRQHVEALEPSVPRADEALAEASEVFLARRVALASGGAAAAAGGYKTRRLQDLTVRTVFPNGLAESFRQTVFQVLTPEGAQASRTLPVQFDQDTQRFELRSARVYRADGSIDESATLQEYQLAGGASRMYYDSRAMVVTFPRLEPGDVVEARWRVDDVAQRNAFADYFGDLSLFQGDAPRAQVRYVLRAPASRALHFREPALPTLRRTERVDGDTRWYDFVATDVPALQPELHAPGATERAAYLHVSTYRTWQDVGRWYWGLVRDQLTADDRVRGLVREATRGATTTPQRVRAVYNWVVRNTRYVALEFGIHGFLPYRVPDVCTRGFGDCKDKASTIVTMLRELGIDASLVLVRTRHNGRVDDTPASLAVFDHAIAYVPPMEGYPEGVFLDGTAQSHGMDELPMEDQGAMGLVINQRGEAQLVRIPVYRPEQNTASARGEFSLDATGSATGRVVHELRGPGAGPIRSALEAEGTRVERIEGWLSPSYPGVHVGSVRTSDLTELDRPARLEYEATLPTYAARQGNTLLFAPFAPLNLTREFAQHSSRTSDVVLSGPGVLEDRRALRLPPGATLGELPPAATVDTPWVGLELRVERTPGGLVATRTYSVRADRVPAADYARFREACQRIDEAIARRITVTLAGSQ